MKKYLLVIVCLLLITASCSNLDEQEVVLGEAEELTTIYCLEWDGWIQRDNLIFNCLDLFTDPTTIKCNYQIVGDQLFVQSFKEPIVVKSIYDYNETEVEQLIEEEKTYNCSMWVDAYIT